MDKYVRIAGKRQVTIPLDFSQLIINDLIDEGLTGEALKVEFAKRCEGMMAAMRELVVEARREFQNDSESNGDDFMNELINTDE